MVKETNIMAVEKDGKKVLGTKQINYVNGYTSTKLSLSQDMMWSGVAVDTPHIHFIEDESEKYYILRFDFINDEYVVPFNHELYADIESVLEEVSNSNYENMEKLVRRLVKIVAINTDTVTFADALLTEMMSTVEWARKQGYQRKAHEIRNALGL